VRVCRNDIYAYLSKSMAIEVASNVNCAHLSELLGEMYALLLYYAAFSCNSLPTFRDNPSVPYSRVKNSKKIS
jgi:hypothetical protein